MIPELLARWSAEQPTVCRKFLQVFAIDIYHFWVNDAGEFSACLVADLGIQVSGQPALDWLEGAVRRAIEVDPGKCKLQLFGDLGWRADVGPSSEAKFYKSATVALLTAWVEYLEGQ